MLRGLWRIISGFWWLVVGILVVFKHLFFRRATTIQFPKQRMEMWPRFRGRIGMIPGDNGAKHKCTGCGQCVRICPAACIFLDTHKEEGVKGLIVDRYGIDLGLCIYCAFCVEICPFGALRTVTDYEISVYDKNELMWEMDRLLEPRRVPRFRR